MRYQLGVFILTVILIVNSSSAKALSFYQDTSKEQLKKEVSEINEIPLGAEDPPLNFVGPKSSVKINNPLREEHDGELIGFNVIFDCCLCRRADGGRIVDIVHYTASDKSTTTHTVTGFIHKYEAKKAFLRALTETENIISQEIVTNKKAGKIFITVFEKEKGKPTISILWAKRTFLHKIEGTSLDHLLKVEAKILEEDKYKNSKRIK